MEAGILIGSLSFPDSCCKCMAPVTRYEIVEGRIPTRTWTGRAAFPVKTQKEADHIARDAQYTRFWYPIPYCDKHNLKSKALHFHTSTVLPATDKDWMIKLAMENCLRKRITCRELGLIDLYC